MSSLPIEAIKYDFNQTINEQHVVVEAETGSGKSTRLPLWSSHVGRVLVIEPRRIACTSLAEYTAKLEGSKLGDRIGYAIKLDAQYTDKTKVVFVTPGVALRWFTENQLQDFNVIMVDEFHERRWDTDLLVAILKKRNTHRLVITSATIEGEKLARYIGAKRLTASGRLHDVTISYAAFETHSLPDKKCIEINVVNVIKERIADCYGDILVFLPGRKEIAQCAQALSKLESITVVSLHASVSDSERALALQKLDSQKIVLATNVAETSLTIPNIALVIDTGLERRTLQRNGRTVLSLKAISKASATQRAGRAGRVMDGHCVRLYGKHAALESVTPPELLREDLTEPMLASTCCGYVIDSLEFMDKLSDKSFQSAKLQLESMRAIDASGKPTEHGRRLYPLPIDTLYADLLTRMPDKASQEAMVDLAAGLSVSSSLYKLPTSKEKLATLAEWEKQQCDAELVIKLVRGESCDGLIVDAQAMAEARALACQMRAMFELPDLEVSSRINRKIIFDAIAEIHPELIFVRREKRRQMLTNGKTEIALAKNSRFNDCSEAAIVFDSHSLAGYGSKQTLILGTILFPIPLSYIEHSSLGEWQQTQTVVQEDALYSELSLEYAGRCIAKKKVQPEGEMLLKPLVEAVKSGVLMPGFASKRIEEIKHWHLYMELGLSNRQANVCDHKLDFDVWFTTLLVDLGITDLEELSLFDSEDLLFDGIPYWEYLEFAQSYPFTLRLADLLLSVDYFPSRKRVHVVFKSGSRKGDPKRWELPVWKGWRIQYKKGSRVIDVR